MNFKIGNLNLSSKVLLAPMCGYTDLSFRLAIRQFGGIGLAFTEMISPRSVLSGGGVRREAILSNTEEDTPLGWQLYGNDPALMAEAAIWLVKNRNAALIDINMGCPQRKISGRGSGAGLLRTPDVAVKLVAAVVEAVTVPVTVKMRLGTDAANSHIASELVPALEQAGVAALTIHGRTLAQRYSGAIDIKAIQRVVERAQKIPVIGNGDITSIETARKLLEETGCSAVMIGRAALKHPWLPRDIDRALAGLPPLPPPSRNEKTLFMLRHYDSMTNQYGEKTGALLFRRWIPQYAKALETGKNEMIELLRITNPIILREKLRSLQRRSYNAFCQDWPDQQDLHAQKP